MLIKREVDLEGGIRYGELYFRARDGSKAPLIGGATN